MRVSLLGAVLAGFLVGGCPKEEVAQPKGQPPPPGVKLGPAQKVGGTPITIRLAKGWSTERLEGAEKPDPETPPPGLIDLTETQEVWKASTPSPSGRADAFILIAVDNRLPKGTSLQAYLEALRKEQQRQVAAKVRHLEVERIERDGRPGYSLRDAMDVATTAGGSAPLHQIARIFINGTMGISVTAMMLEDDRAQLDGAIRAMMESIQFTSPPPKVEDSFVP